MKWILNLKNWKCKTKYKNIEIKIQKYINMYKNMRPQKCETFSIYLRCLNLSRSSRKKSFLFFLVNLDI